MSSISVGDALVAVTSPLSRYPKCAGQLLGLGGIFWVPVLSFLAYQ